MFTFTFTATIADSLRLIFHDFPLLSFNLRLLISETDHLKTSTQNRNIQQSIN